jgi:hypothetical protein
MRLETTKLDVTASIYTIFIRLVKFCIFFINIMCELQEHVLFSE